MSTLSPPQPQIKLCNFHPNFKTNTQYICYRYEKCCRQGCCSTYSYTYFQSWYFWSAVLLFFVAFYMASWYCKKVEMEKRRIRAAREISGSALSSRPSTAPNSSRRRTNDNGVDHLLDYLIQSYRIQSINVPSAPPRGPGRNLEPPPKYHDAINMPKLERCSVQVHVNSSDPLDGVGNLGGSSEVPPTYEDATQDSEQMEPKNC